MSLQAIFKKYFGQLFFYSISGLTKGDLEKGGQIAYQRLTHLVQQKDFTSLRNLTDDRLLEEIIKSQDPSHANHSSFQVLNSSGRVFLSNYHGSELILTNKAGRPFLFSLLDGPTPLKRFSEGNDFRAMSYPEFQAAIYERPMEWIHFFHLTTLEKETRATDEAEWKAKKQSDKLKEDFFENLISKGKAVKMLGTTKFVLSYTISAFEPEAAPNVKIIDVSCYDNATKDF